MSSQQQQQPTSSNMSNDLLKRILLTTVHRPVSVTGEGANFSATSESIYGGQNVPDSLNTVRMMKPTIREDALLTTAAYGQRHYRETPASIGAFEQDSNLGDYSMDDLSPQGLNGSGDDPMLTIGMDQDSSGTYEHSNSDPIAGSESCYSISQMSQDKMTKRKGRPSKGYVASSSVHGRFGVRCPICGKAFNNSSALAKHKLTHSDERKYVCQICSKTFKRQDHLNGHMLTHSSKKPFECKFKDCGKSYCDARSLKRHLEHHHALDGSLPTNNQSAFSAYDTATHREPASNQSSSTLVGNYTEQFSPVSSTSGSSNGDKTHPSLSSWPTNLSVLDEPLPHKCDLCNRCFKNLPALNGHMRLHGGYFKKDGAVDDSSLWTLEASKRKPSSLSLASVSSAIQGSEKTIAKLSSVVSSGIMQPELNALYLPEAAQAQQSAHHHSSSAVNTDSVGFDAIATHQEAVVMATSKAPETGRMQEPQQRIQLLNVPSSFALSLNHVDFLKLHDQRMAYLPSESTNISESDGIAFPNDAVANMGQQFYHLTSLPTLSLLPNATLKSEIAFKHFASSPSKSRFPKDSISVETDENYRYRLFSTEALGRDTVSKHIELRKRLSGADSDTDSAKDTDPEEDAPMLTKETKTPRERRRWASADADRFTSGKTKVPIQSPGNANWKIGASTLVHRFSREPCDNEGDGPPTIDDIRNLEATRVGEEMEREFRNPNITPALLLKFRRKNRPEPLIIPPQSSGFAFHSRLRSPRIGGINLDSKLTFTPYTPPPMLSPIRNGSGLFCQLSSKSPVSAPVGLRTGFTSRRNSRVMSLAPFPASEVIEEEEEEQDVEEEVVDMEPEPPVLEAPPETDISPHVNIGPEYQAEIPSINPNRPEELHPEREVLVWDPAVVQNLKESELRTFMDFACCAAVPFNGSNREYAHHVLSNCAGNIKRAVLKIMQRNPSLASEHTLHSYVYQEADVWDTKEIAAFQDGLTKFDKDFFRVSKHVGTKSTQKCIQFYYMWKKIACDEHKRLRIIRRKREQENLYNLRSSKVGETKVEKAVEENIKNFSSEGLQLPFSAYVASDNSVGGEPDENIIAEADLPFSNFHDVTCDLQYEETVETEEYPCRICGKVFSKVKSRSAHMKTHRPMGNVPQQQTDRGRQTYSPQDSWQFHPS